MPSTGSVSFFQKRTEGALRPPSPFIGPPLLLVLCVGVGFLVEWGDYLRGGIWNEWGELSLIFRILK